MEPRQPHGRAREFAARRPALRGLLRLLYAPAAAHGRDSRPAAPRAGGRAAGQYGRRRQEPYERRLERPVYDRGRRAGADAHRAPGRTAVPAQLLGRRLRGRPLVRRRRIRVRFRLGRRSTVQKRGLHMVFRRRGCCGWVGNPAGKRRMDGGRSRYADAARDASERQRPGGLHAVRRGSSGHRRQCGPVRVLCPRERAAGRPAE